MIRATHAREEVEQWLVKTVSKRLKVPEGEIDLSVPITSYGLDSAEGVALQADLETWLGREVSPTIVWDYPSIREMATHLAKSS